MEKKTALIWQFGKTSLLLSAAAVFATAGYFEDVFVLETRTKLFSGVLGLLAFSFCLVSLDN